MASGQASHTPVLTAAGAPNVALGLQVRSTPEYSRVPYEYPRVLACVRGVPLRSPVKSNARTHTRTHGRAGGRALQRAALSRRMSASSPARRGGAARRDDRAKDERGGRDGRADGHAGTHLYMYTIVYAYIYLYLSAYIYLAGARAHLWMRSSARAPPLRVRLRGGGYLRARPCVCVRVQSRRIAEYICVRI